MMPHQIYCDYLEDKGTDCRLLRIMETEGLFIINGNYYNDSLASIALYNGCGYGGGRYLREKEWGDGYGYGWCYGLTDGDGHSVRDIIQLSLDK